MINHNSPMRYYKITMNVHLKQVSFYARSRVGHFDTLLHFTGDSLAGEYHSPNCYKFYTPAGYAYVRELTIDELKIKHYYRRVNCK